MRSPAFNPRSSLRAAGPPGHPFPGHPGSEGQPGAGRLSPCPEPGPRFSPRTGPGAEVWVPAGGGGRGWGGKHGLVAPAGLGLRRQTRRIPPALPRQAGAALPGWRGGALSFFLFKYRSRRGEGGTDGGRRNAAVEGATEARQGCAFLPARNHRGCGEILSGASPGPSGATAEPRTRPRTALPAAPPALCLAGV